MAALLCLLIIGLQAFGEPLRGWLRYERQGIFAGEVWRLLTAHFVHLGWAHALLNACGVMLCCAMAPNQFQPAHAGRLALRLLVLSIGVSGLLLIFSPQISNYVGLSGVLYGLYLLGFAPLARDRDPITITALLLLGGWTLWQLLAGPSADEERLIGGNIVSQAHLYGLLTAAGWLLLERLRLRRRP